MNVPPATGSPLATLGHFARMPREFAHYVIDPVAAGRVLGVEPEQAAGLAAGALPHARSAQRGPLYDYVDVINLALFGGVSGQSIPGLALRFLLRFATGARESWFTPLQWLVRVRAPDSAAADAESFQGRLMVRPADLGAPGIEALSDDYVTRTAPALATGKVEPPGYAVAVRVTGAAGTVRSGTVNRIYDEMLAALLSGTVVYQSVTEELRMRQRRAWALGMADCVVISRLLVDRLHDAGLAARARRGYLLGLVGSDHAWCEVFEDGRWKPLDVVFEFLASGGGGTRSIQAADGFAAACRGGRFNRLLPCQAADAGAVIRIDGEPAPPWWTCGVSATTWQS